MRTVALQANGTRRTRHQAPPTPGRRILHDQKPASRLARPHLGTIGLLGFVRRCKVFADRPPSWSCSPQAAGIRLSTCFRPPARRPPAPGVIPRWALPAKRRLVPGAITAARAARRAWGMPARVTGPLASAGPVDLGAASLFTAAVPMVAIASNARWTPIALARRRIASAAVASNVSRTPSVPRVAPAACQSDQFCDPAWNTCVSWCKDARDCTMGRPLCDTYRNACVECSANDYCAFNPRGHVCYKPLGSCVECEDSKDCADPDAPICNTADFTCHECVKDTDCGFARLCKDGRCTSPPPPPPDP